MLDRLGMIGSSLCALHCLACAFLPGLLGILGLGALLGSGAEWGFTAFTILIASLALWVGFRRHRSLKVATLFLVGIAGLLLSRAIEESSEHPLAASHEVQVVESGSPKVVVDHHDHEGGWDLHFWGSIIGIMSGFPIIMGHFLSIKKSRCCEDNCVATGETGDSFG